MHSLPQPTQPNQQAASGTTSGALSSEEVVPLAQLPTSTRKPETTQPAASPSAAVTAEPSASVAVPEPMKIASEPQPIAPAERAVDEPAKPKTNTIVSTAPAGSAQE